MAHSLEIHAVPLCQGPVWERVRAIYHQAFPDWEREPDDVIARRVAEGNYLLFAGSEEDGAVLAFYLLEINPEQDYVLFNFLAVDAQARGRGYGTQLCRDAMHRFRSATRLSWLLIEAEERQACFYGRLGFRRLDIEYQVPKFGDPGSVPMHLMALHRENIATDMEGACLRAQIHHIFTHGYLLEADDARIDAQLGRVPEQVNITAWPLEESKC